MESAAPGPVELRRRNSLAVVYEPGLEATEEVEVSASGSGGEPL